MNTPIVIAGAGPVGLSLALGLSRHGVSSLVLETKEELSPHSRAPALHARTLEIFRAWGVLDRLMGAGTFLTEADLWLVGHPKPVAHLDLRSLAAHSATPGLLILPQNRTEAILLDEVRAQGMAEVRFGHTLTGFQQDGDGVTITVSPQGGSPYVLKAELLVGCDGAHSTVRERLGWQLEGKTYPTRLMIADVRLPDERNALPWPRAHVTSTRFCFAIRIEPELWRIISTLPPGESEEESVSPGAIATRVSSLFGAGPFERVWASHFHIHCRTSPHFRLGRVLLAGDAAHLNSPVGGQGMNSGIQDAHNLAWKLARALADGDEEALLDSYEQERRPAILMGVDRFTDLLTRAVLLAGPRTRAAIARLARSALRTPALMARLAPKIGMLDVRYGPSSLISGDAPLLGARAPDGELIDATGQMRRLHDLVARDAALLLFDDGRLPRWDRESVARLLAPLAGLKVFRLLRTTVTPEGEDLRDARGDLWEKWRAAGGMAALVRPDGHLGWRADRPDPDQLSRGIAAALGAERI
jgi:2-polyprenyl-6-methoxyphenol hydroxylase-like FAD-dependent oxidoreductase